MIKGYETKDVKASKTKAKPEVREQGVIFKNGELWSFVWGNGQENFTTEEFAKTALARLSNEQ